MPVSEAILLSIQAWNAVTRKTIQNCFNHSSIRIQQDQSGATTAVTNQLQALVILQGEIYKQVQELRYPQPISIEEMLDLPEENTILIIPTDEEIVASIQECEEENDVEEIEECVILPPPSIEKSIQALQTQIRYEESIEEWDGQAEFLYQLIKRSRQLKTRQFEY